jgi:hypothetical protein
VCSVGTSEHGSNRPAPRRAWSPILEVAACTKEQTLFPLPLAVDDPCARSQHGEAYNNRNYGDTGFSPGASYDDDHPVVTSFVAVAPHDTLTLLTLLLK